jgi:hypothetical protein
MKRLAFVLFCISWLACGQAWAAQNGSSQNIKRFYYAWMNGNMLYADCEKWETEMSIVGTNAAADADAPYALQAATCYGYVLGVVDSMAVGEGFDPDLHTDPSQFIDAVFNYLKNHPGIRQRAGYFLARDALIEAFPARGN